MTSNLGLDPNQISKVTAILSGTLADCIVLQTKTRNFHWNVKGKHFSELHAFFEDQYKQLDAAADEIAERIRQLGVDSPGSLKQFLALTSLEEATGSPDEISMLAQLLTDHETLVRSLRKNVEETASLGDAGNSDFLTGLLQAHEKMAWMLRSYLA